MTEISKIPTGGIQPQKSQLQQPKQISDGNESKSNAKNIAIGLGIASVAITAAVLGGLRFKNNVAEKKLASEASELTSKISDLKNYLSRLVDSQKNNEKFQEVFNPEVLQKHIDETSKLGKKEQLARLKDIEANVGSSFANELQLSDARRPFKISDLPESIQRAISAKDEYTATKEYAKYCDTLFMPSPNAGKPVEEAITNSLGKETKVKPHTYDISKEADRIGTAQYSPTGSSTGGYTDVTFMNDGRIADFRNMKETRHVYSTMPDFVEGENARIVQGTFEGRPTVGVVYRDIRKSDILNCVRLESPNVELTPAQADLLRIKDNINDLNIQDLQILTAQKGDIKTDYNVILSVIEDLKNQSDSIF